MLGLGGMELFIILILVGPPFIGIFFDRTLWKNQNPNAKMSLPQVLFSFRGRINRQKWWLMIIEIIRIFVCLIATVFSIVTSSGVLFGLGHILSLWCLALDTKRWHDRNKSAWRVLIGFLPIIQIWAFVELGFLKGTEGPNRFGSDPLEQS